jgi:hypothetical protein
LILNVEEGDARALRGEVGDEDSPMPLAPPVMRTRRP